MFEVTVRDHMMVAHSLRGEVFGPAQALHGATYVVDATFVRGELDGNGIVVDIGLAGQALNDALSDLTYTNLDDHPAFTGRNSTTEALAREVADRLVARVLDGRLGLAPGDLARVRVTLHESPTAWVSYEREVAP